MLGFPILYCKGMRSMMFQLSGFCYTPEKRALDMELWFRVLVSALWALGLGQVLTNNIESSTNMILLGSLSI